jgi:hypothetical protein
MRKIKLLLILAITGLVMSCNNGTQNSKEENADSNSVAVDSAKADKVAEVTEVSFVELTDSMALALNGKVVKISGTVDHVCKHGGKRLMLVGTNPDERIRVEAGDNPPFDQELAGSEIEVTGKLVTEKIDSTYLADLENELKEKKEEGVKEVEKQHIDAGHHEKEEGEEHHGEDESVDEQLQQIQHLKETIANNGKGYIVSKHIELIEYKKIK